MSLTECCGQNLYRKRCPICGKESSGRPLATLFRHVSSTARGMAINDQISDNVVNKWCRWEVELKALIDRRNV